MTSIGEWLQVTNEQLEDMNNRLSTLEKSQLRLETRMENEIVNKILALSDSFELKGNQIENLKKHVDERFDNIEIDTGYLVSKVARLEGLAK